MCVCPAAGLLDMLVCLSDSCVLTFLVDDIHFRVRIKLLCPRTNNLHCLLVYNIWYMTKSIEDSTNVGKSTLAGVRIG